MAQYRDFVCGRDAWLVVISLQHESGVLDAAEHGGEDRGIDEDVGCGEE